MTDIYRGHLTREEAIRLVHRFDGEFPSDYYEHFKEYLGITDEQFWNVINAFRSLSNVWEEVDGEWNLKHQVY